MSLALLWVTEYFPTTENAITGGIESRTWYLAKHLSKEHNLTIITSWKQGQPRVERLQHNILIYRVGSHHPYTNQGYGAFISRIRFMQAAKKVAKKLKKPDLVEGHNFISYLPAQSIANHFRIPSIATYHEVWIGKWVKTKGFLTGIAGNIIEQVVIKKKWNHVISVSRFTKKKLQKQGISKRRITIIPNGIELSQRKRKKFKESTICYVGRLTKEKRVIDLLKAASFIQKTIPTIRVIIIGEGQERANLMKFAKKMKISVKFTGFLKNKEKVQELLERSHIFCSPSILEGFGITVIEAASAGTPYVITNIISFREITSNGVGGIIINKKNPQEIALAICNLLVNKNLYKNKQLQARKLSKEYQWENISTQVSQLYQKIIKSFKNRNQRGE